MDEVPNLQTLPAPTHVPRPPPPTPSNAHGVVTLTEDMPAPVALECELETLPLTDGEAEYRDISESDMFAQRHPAPCKQYSSPSNYSAVSDPASSSPDISPLASEAEPFNPFQLMSKRSIRLRSEELLDSLSFNAVELSVEIFGMARAELFSNPSCFAAIFVQGLAPGEWTLFDRSEEAGSTNHIRFVKKFRLRAATQFDRDEGMMVAIFDRNAQANALNPTKGLGYEEFSVAELLQAKQMIVEKNLKAEKKGTNVKGQILLALEMVYHVDQDYRITLEFGFLNSAPLRNRMFFVISRALRRGKWSPVYRSEIRLRDDVSKFEPVSLSAQEFHGGDVSKLFRIEVHRAYKNGQNKLLGFMQTSLEKLSSMEPNSQLYWWPAREGITSAKVLVQDVEHTASEQWFCLRLAGHH